MVKKMLNEDQPSHVFLADPEALKSERRKKIMPVGIFEKEVLANFGFKNIAVDYGAGIGYFTIPLARYFKKVYAIELNEEMVENLERELKNAGIYNVEIVISDTPPELGIDLDFILFSNVLHEVNDYNKFLDRATKAKVVCVIEWKNVETDFGPPVEHRIDRDELKNALKKRFQFVKELNIYPYHYVLIGSTMKTFGKTKTE